MLISILPILLYEAGAIGFYVFTLGTINFERLHQVAWAQDLAMAIPFFCFIILVYQIYINFVEEEECRVDIPKYERPPYEKYMWNKYNNKIDPF
jgi:hypothetical protein